jgi:hypothetical protein
MRTATNLPGGFVESQSIEESVRLGAGVVVAVAGLHLKPERSPLGKRTSAIRARHRYTYLVGNVLHDSSMRRKNTIHRLVQERCPRTSTRLQEASMDEAACPIQLLRHRLAFPASERHARPTYTCAIDTGTSSRRDLRVTVGRITALRSHDAISWIWKPDSSHHSGASGSGRPVEESQRMLHADSTSRGDRRVELYVRSQALRPEKRKVGGSTPPLPTHRPSR